MFTLNKAMQLLQLAEREYSSLNNELIAVKMTGEFSAICGLLDSQVTIGEKENKGLKQWLVMYLKEFKDLKEVQYMFYDFEECFAFLHEVGHIYYKDINQGEEEHYRAFKEKTYNSYYQAFKAYRNIPTEQLADHFALTVIGNRLNMIYSIMNEQTLEEAIEEVEFWGA